MSSTSSKSCWAFDVDGVLVNSRHAVTVAYRLAGVEMPASAWGLPWQDWLPDLVDNPLEVRRRKSEEYLSLIEAGALETLPMANFAQMLEGEGVRVAYVTSSSDPSASAIVKSLQLDHTCLLGTNLQPHERARKLAGWGDHGTYVDDRAQGHDIARDAGWNFLHAEYKEYLWTP